MRRESFVLRAQPDAWLEPSVRDSNCPPVNFPSTRQCRGSTRLRKEGTANYRSARPAIGLPSVRLWLSPPLLEQGHAPPPIRGGPTGSASVGVVAAYGRRPVFMCSASLASPFRAGFRLRLPRAGSACLGLGPPHHRRPLRLGDLPAVSGRASCEVPGCGHAPCAVSPVARPDLGLLLRLVGRGPCAGPSGSLAMPRSEDRWRPACRPLPTARPRRVTFHLYKCTEGAGTVSGWREEKSRSLRQAAGLDSGTRQRESRMSQPHPSLPQPEE